MEQEDVREANLVGIDAERMEGTDIHTAHLDILDAALAERVQLSLSGPDAPLRPDLSIEFVLDLQQGRRQLAVVRAVGEADSLIRGIGLGERTVERRRVALKAVEA